jgi:ABC-2 type transport system permease protein
MRLWPVVRREYLERVRSRVFIISTIAGPLLMAGVMFLPTVIMRKERGEALRVAVVDASGQLAESISDALSSKRANDAPRFAVVPTPAGDADRARAQLRSEILAGRVDGYLYLPPDALAHSSAEYYGKAVTNFMDQGLMREAVDDVLLRRRLTQEGLDPARIKALTRPLSLKTVRVSATGEREERGGSTMVALAMMMLLYTSVLMWGQALMSSVIEEKSNRVVEVVVSSIHPTVLLAGKLLGVGAAGLTQTGVWALTMGLLGGTALPMAAAAGLTAPEPIVIVGFVIFFLLGFFFYAALYGAIGAAVNSVQEAQSLAFPMVVPQVLSIVFFGTVLQSPGSTLSTVLSLIPCFTPLLMFLRIAVLTPPLWQILLAVVLMLLTISAVTWVAARIYRVGILMYGKRPTLPEIMRWVGRA